MENRNCFLFYSVINHEEYFFFVKSENPKAAREKAEDIEEAEELPNLYYVGAYSEESAEQYGVDIY